MYGTAQAETTLPVVVTIEEEFLKEWIDFGNLNSRSHWETHRMWDEESIITAVERVNRGAALLDREEPTWVEKVVPCDVRMADGQVCIIGQVYGEYDKHLGIPFGMDHLVKDDEGYLEFVPEELSQKAAEHGFFQNGVPFELLDRVWVYLLTQRQKRDAPVFLALPEGF